MSQYSHLTADLTNEGSVIAKVARLIGPDRRVLDVGCAHGYGAEALGTLGCRVVGVERDAEDAARARAYCEQVLVADVEQPGWTAALGAGRFDVVLFSDVLEHLRDPGQVLREALGVLEPERGAVVASVPNVAHVSVRLELLLGSFRRETLGILDATHLHFFTRETLEELLVSSGLAVESWDCTTNEVADPVIVEYLRRAGMSYTPALRDAFARSGAMAYQFILKARPAARQHSRLVEMVEKPLEVMQRLHATRLGEPRDAGLRVLQVVDQFPPGDATAPGAYCADLAFALARRGHAVRVLSTARVREDVGTTMELDGELAIVVDRVAATRTYRTLGTVGRFFDGFDNPEARPVVRWLLDQMQPDVVHIHQLGSLSAELIPECRNRGIPRVVTLNDYWFLCHQGSLVRRDGECCDGPARGRNCCQCLEWSKLARSRLNPVAVGANLYRYEYLRRQLLKVDRILAPSRFVREVFRRNGIPTERMTLCPYGTPSPPPYLGTWLPDRRRHDRVRFGFFGALTREQGAHVLVEAFAAVPAGQSELHVFAAPVDRRYAEELHRRSIHPDIHWHGPVTRRDRWEALAAIDALVVPSTWQAPSPFAIHQAHAARVPVIGAAIGGIPELVQHGATGLTFPAGDAKALAACLQSVIADPDCLARWRRAIVPPKAMEPHVEGIEALYRQLCAARRPRPAPATVGAP